jgi:hypothetical protein
MKTQRIIFYTQLAYQLLGTNSDIVPYSEFLSAFDDLAAACRARGQSFEKVYIDIPMMLQWQRDNGHKNDNAGRAAFSETLHAIHPDIDYVPKQTSTGRDRRTTPGAAEEGIRRLVCRSPARLSCYARGFRLAALPMSKHRTMTDELTVIV